MKNMKKLVSVLLTLVMALTVPAFAAQDTTISAPSDSTRTYDVYQIFTGDLHDGVLSNVKWGKNGTDTEGTAVPQGTLDALTAVNGKSDTEKLAEIQKYVSFDTNAIGTVSKDHPLTVPTGYYLIKDLGVKQADGSYLIPDGETYSLFVVQIVGDTTIIPKTGTTSSEKKVQDTNDSTGDTSIWQDSADYDIGDDVPFLLKGTVASDYDRYTSYKFFFHDKESSGLDFDASTVVVKVDGTQIDSGYTVATTGLDDDCTFEVQFADLKKISSVRAGSVITVEYKSTLTENAVVGSTGNSNEMYLEYSNNPNSDGTGATGKTPEDTVVVFTYKTIINKITKNPAYDPEVEGSKEYIPLTGAEFTLEKKILEDNPATSEVTETEYWKPITVVKNDEGTTFTFSGLDDGDYRLTETTTPAGYNTVAPIEFTITAEHNINSATPAITSLSGNATSGELTFTSNTSAGSLTANVVNNAGAVLPETGGIGTTIFYVLGSILVLGAGILLVTKKRMGSEK